MSKEKELKNALIFQKAVVAGLENRFSRVNSEYRRASQELSREIGEAYRKMKLMEDELGELVRSQKGVGVVIWDDSFGIEKVENVYYSADECPCSISKQVFELVLDFDDYIKMGCIAGRPA